MPTEIRISVIIPNWNGSPFLFELLTSLTRTAGTEREIILVDNHSTDPSVAMIETFYPGVRIVRNRQNGGYGQAVNLGLYHARGDLMILVNTDISWTDDWIGRCRDFLAAREEYDFAVPAVHNYYHRHLLDSAGDRLNRRLMPLKRGFGLPASALPAEGCDLQLASGSALAIRRRFFDRVGGFDESYFMYYEDTDLFWRGLLKRSKGRLLPGAVVYHREGGSMARRQMERRGAETDKEYLLARNRCWLIGKNCPAGYLVLASPLLFLEWIRTGLSYVLRGQGLLFLRAQAASVRHWPVLRRKRKLIQKHRSLRFREWMKVLRAG